MKKALLLLTGAAFVLAGCQDEQPQQSAKPVAEAQAEIVIDAPTDNQHTANTALDWNGTYVGILPCADCSGIETQITLNHDGSYTATQTYLGKEDGLFESQGQFHWNDKGNIVTLENETGANQYFVGENILFKLDMNGERVEGDLAERYQLHKQ